VADSGWVNHIKRLKSTKCVLFKLCSGAGSGRQLSPPPPTRVRPLISTGFLLNAFLTSKLSYKCRFFSSRIRSGGMRTHSDSRQCYLPKQKPTGHKHFRTRVCTWNRIVLRCTFWWLWQAKCIFNLYVIMTSVFILSHVSSVFLFTTTINKY
jgi:hypothetical protein